MRWTVKDLSNASGVSVPTLHRLEQEEGIPSGRSQTLSDVQKALEKAGIEFTGKPDECPGVTFRKSS